MSYCPGCGTQQESHAPFCGGCGAPLDPAPARLAADPAGPPPAADPASTSVLAPDPGPSSAATDPGAPDLQIRWASTRPATKTRGPLLVLGLALVVLIGGAGAVYALMNQPQSPVAAVSSPQAIATTTAAAPRPAPSRTAAPTPARDAKAAGAVAAAAAGKQISALLDDSSHARGVVATATRGLEACTLSPDQAVADLKTVVANRQRLLDQLAGAPFEALPAGAALRSSLTAAWAASLSADQGYLTWAQSVQASGTCRSGTANVAAYNIAATEAKRTFAGLWNTKVAPVLHLPTRKDTDL